MLSARECIFMCAPPLLPSSSVFFFVCFFLFLFNFRLFVCASFLWRWSCRLKFILLALSTKRLRCCLRSAIYCMIVFPIPNAMRARVCVSECEVRREYLLALYVHHSTLGSMNGGCRCRFYSMSSVFLRRFSVALCGDLHAAPAIEWCGVCIFVRAFVNTLTRK